MLCVYVPAAILAGKMASSTAVALHSLARLLLIKHTLATLNLFTLFPETVLFHLCLLPVLVGNLCQDSSMCLSSSFFIFLEFFVSLLNLSLHYLFTLLDKRSLKPLLELHVTDFLLLLLFEALLLYLLHLHELLVMQLHDLFILPLVHLVRTLLHS